MKRVLAFLCILLFITACSSQRSYTQRSKEPKIMAYVWENGRPENARIDWNRPWNEQYAMGENRNVKTGPAEGTITSGSGGFETRADAEIELRKEELVVGKREVSNGGVLIKKVVRTENVSQPIDLKREEYVIERVPAGQRSDTGAYGFEGKEIYIPLMKEEPVTGIRTYLTERVHVGKKFETDHQMVSHPIRSEDIEIVKNPDLSDRRFANVNRLPSPSFQGETARGGTSAANQSGVERLSGQGSADLDLAKEEFNVGKREVSNGGVLLRKVVKTQDASQGVDLKREEFAIERTPINKQEATSADFREREVQINLTREEPVVGTRNYATEFVKVHKKTETDHQTLAAVVRTEDVQIVKNGESSGRRVSSLSTDQTGQGGTATSTQTVTTKETYRSENGKDQAINDRVRQALANGTLGSTDSATTLDYSNIEISTRNGVVTLRGTVKSEAEKKRIAKRVEELSGVRSVKNELKVSATE